MQKEIIGKRSEIKETTYKYYFIQKEKEKIMPSKQRYTKPDDWWLSGAPKEDPDPVYRVTEHKSINYTTPIAKLHKDTNIVLATYPNAVEAAIDTGGMAERIVQVLLLKRSTHKGFKWQFANN